MSESDVLEYLESMAHEAAEIQKPFTYERGNNAMFPCIDIRLNL